ncbi:uncharacterized protein K441DRAFT_677447 [Cenococcum geophilum 1.58]|uniref:uncharacterized protein n=1 Tax=Cenococcum geophilum 1.58 TaxID=794803 RepID=UPI00358F6B16|nr:hypothetical protein K441DRAFT_677447 [Cenococcum geophilum 1.58]
MSLTDSASTPSFNTLGGPTDYYCCGCGFGPQSINMCPKCINCGHTGCSSCESDATEGISGREIGASATTVERVDFTDVSSDVNLTFQRPSPTAFATTRLEGTNIHGLIFDEEANDSEHFTWYCCSCGDGPMGTANNAGCCECGHWRCEMCSVEGGK